MFLFVDRRIVAKVRQDHGTGLARELDRRGEIGVAIASRDGGPVVVAEIHPMTPSPGPDYCTGIASSRLAAGRYDATGDQRGREAAWQSRRSTRKRPRTSTTNFHFSQAVRAGELLICSGQIGTGADGKVPADLADEFRNAWHKVGGVLKAAKFEFSDVLEYTSYHVGMQSTIGTFMKVRDEVLSEPWPAWTAIGITELAVPGAHVEIRVTARKRK